MPRKKESITINLSLGERESLEEIALAFGCTWGEKANISALMSAIAQDKLKVDWADAEPADNPKRAAMLGAIALIQEGLAKLLRLL